MFGTIFYYNYFKKVLDNGTIWMYNIIKVRDKKQITNEIENKCLSKNLKIISRKYLTKVQSNDIIKLQR